MKRPYVTLSVVLRETIDVEGLLAWCASGEDVLLRAASGIDIGSTGGTRSCGRGTEAVVRSRVVRRKLGTEIILLGECLLLANGMDAMEAGKGTFGSSRSLPFLPCY